MNSACFIIPKQLCNPSLLKHGVFNCNSSTAQQAFSFRCFTSITSTKRHSSKVFDKTACVRARFDAPKLALQFVRPLRSSATGLKSSPADNHVPRIKPHKLPPRYYEKVRVPFGIITGANLSQIFQQDVNYVEGNEVLRMLQERRVNGSLVDKGVQPEAETSIPPEAVLKALEWLRKKYPVDEQDAAQHWAAIQVGRIEATYIADAERLGIYKAPDGPAARPTTNTSTSVLEEFRAYNIKKSADEAKALEKSGEAQKSRELALARQEVKEQIQTQSEERITKRREVRAKKGRVTEDGEPPYMSQVQRILRPLTFGIGFMCLVSLAAELYTPVQQADRIFPQIPIAIATIGAIAGLNFFVFLLWRVPLAWRIMNKYFTQVPAYPFSLSVLGNTISHQRFSHLLSNLFVLCLVGVQVHEDIGRAQFVELYLNGCITGSLFSLVYYVLQRDFSVFTQGASGGVHAILAAWAVLQLDKPKASTATPEFALDVSRWSVIGIVLLGHFVPSVRINMDWLSHVGGAAVGLILMWSRRSSRSRNRSTDEDSRSDVLKESASIDDMNLSRKT